MKKIIIFPSDSIEVCNQRGGIKPRYFNPDSFFDEVHIISLSDKEIEEEKVHNIAGTAKLKIYPVGSFSLKRPWKIFDIKRKVFRILKSIEPDVIRAYDPKLNGAMAAFFGKRLSISVVVSIHADFDGQRDFYKNRKKTFKKTLWHYFSKKVLEPFSISSATRIICVSHFLKHYAKDYGGKDVAVIYNKVYASQFAKPRDFPGLKSKIKILSVGRFIPLKNQECLIRAIQYLDVELLLIGEGEDYDKLKAIVNKLSISQKVKFIRSVPHKEIQKHYWDADIFAIASFSEGFCIPLLEAMAAGLPVVVNNREPLTEILGGTGLVVENNPKSFKKAFERLISSPELRYKLGQGARKRALELDGRIMEEKEAMLYKNLIGQYKRSSNG